MGAREAKEHHSTYLIAVVILAFVIIAFSLPNASADDEREEEGSVARLGWLAIAAGTVATVPFVAYNYVKRAIVNVRNTLTDKFS